MPGTVQVMVDGFCKTVDEDVGASTISVRCGPVVL